jgi:hypothetical protein
LQKDGRSKKIGSMRAMRKEFVEKHKHVSGKRRPFREKSTWNERPSPGTSNTCLDLVLSADPYVAYRCKARIAVTECGGEKL